MERNDRKRRGPYRRYLVDNSAKVPKQTASRHRHRKSQSLHNPRTEADSASGQQDEYPTVGAYGSPDDAAENICENDTEQPSESDDSDTEPAYMESEHNAFNDKENRPFEGAQINMKESMLLIMTFALRHGLSGHALDDLLSLIELHCAAPNNLKTSLKGFRALFTDLNSPLQCCFYCTSCGKCWQTPQSENKPGNTPQKCTHCSRLIHNSNCFLVLPLAEQLKNVLDGEFPFYTS